MTSRQGLYVALIGLVIAVPCGIAALLIPHFSNAPPGNGWENNIAAGVLLAAFGLFVGFILMLVGLAMAVAGAVMKPS